MYKRPIALTLQDHLKGNSRFIQVVLGPRQVGKTTAINQILKEIKIPHHYASADLPAPPPTSWIAQQWEIIRLRKQQSKPTILVLDEIQKMPQWSVEVKRLWDEDRRLENNIHVVLLESSSLLIAKGLDESLAGRFEVVRFPHWSWAEMRDCFGWTLDQYIYFGGYPASAALVPNEDRWRQYIRDSLIETAISKDILLLNRVEKPVLLRQLFVLANEYSGQILSYQKILGQLQDVGNTVTIAHYQRLLEGAFLIRGLPKWSGNTLRLRNSSPKWLALNTGLWTALSSKSFNTWKNDPVQWGRLVEAAVGAHLANAAPSLGADVYYWREGNDEVDYVLHKGDHLVAIEVKSGQKVKPARGFESFQKRYPGARCLVVGAGGISLQDFLEQSVAKLVL